MAEKLGPGQLTFGEAGTESEWGAQVTVCAIEPETDEGDTLNFLDGSSESDETDSYTLTGTLAQTYDADSLLIWSKENSGERFPFTFRPRGDRPLTVTGTVTVRALKIGGDVKTKNTSDFSFVGVGDWNIDLSTDPEA